MKTVNLNSVTLSKNGNPVELMGVTDKDERYELISDETINSNDVRSISVANVNLSKLLVIIDSPVVASQNTVMLSINTQRYYDEKTCGRIAIGSTSYLNVTYFEVKCDNGTIQGATRSVSGSKVNSTTVSSTGVCLFEDYINSFYLYGYTRASYRSAKHP